MDDMFVQTQISIIFGSPVIKPIHCMKLLYTLDYNLCR